ncbi:alpha/beta fold hydrolase [Halopseudomonas formosensis]|uniref:Alpha/beta hydrolase n=1 Tax=Halopseudomonas formosensis TaxID=1002526 RepID=A0ABU5BWY4_9GAMM|nr:alpha/beta hydrolase [Halopseudomonas formosensis]MDX9687292.1 alpha/beta hydrolase [Halopseudomonas formosensis]
MTLLPWSHESSAGFTLRGWHTPPSGKPLLHFIHGNGFCTRTYEPMLEKLAGHFDLWLCDMQGHGDSDHGGAFRGWNQNAELAVEAFVAGCPRFGNVPRYACGHSFGGVLTSLFVSAHPQLFERAVLLDPVLFPRRLILLRNLLGPLLRNPMADAARRRRTHWQDAEEAYARLNGRGIFRGWEEEAMRAHVLHALREEPGQGVTLKCLPEREAEIFESSPHGLWRALSRIAIPVRLIHGDQTYPFVRQSALQLAGRNPMVTVESLPGGHCFMQEKSALAAERVRAFLLEG